MEITSKDIKSIKKGNRKKITKLYTASFPMLMSIVVRYKNNEEDQFTLVNDIFMKCLDNLDKFKENTSFFGWMKRLAINTAIDDFRKNKNYRNLFSVDAHFSELESENDLNLNETLTETELEQILNLLPPATKLVFNLFAIDELSLKEISEELDITYETAKWHVKEARKKLRKSLSKELKIIRTDGK